MRSFFQRLLLVQRAREAWDAYRALRCAQHRASLKAKRAAVRARVSLEIHKLQVERTMLRMEAARMVVRVQGVARIAEAQQRRNVAVLKKLKELGGIEPRHMERTGLKGVGKKRMEEQEFKEGIMRRVEGIYEGKGGAVGERVASAVLREAVEEVSLQGETDDTGRNLKMLAGIAKEAGVGWDEMEKLMDMVEPDKENRKELREAVRAAMEKEGVKMRADVGNN